MSTTSELETGLIDETQKDSYTALLGYPLLRDVDSVHLVLMFCQRRL